MTMITLAGAKLLDRAVQSAGEPARALARRVTPMPLKRKASAFLSQNVSPSEETVLAKTGHRFVALKEPVFLQVRYDKVYEKELSGIISSFVSEGNIVADVGANFGWHSVSMAEIVGSEGSVYSYEPNPEMFEALTKNVRLNSFENRTTLRNCAVGEVSGKGSLNADAGQSAIGYVSLEDSSGGEADVEIVSLDDELAEHVGNVAFVKIDVEGFEPFVLKGAERLLSDSNPPVLMVEFSPDALDRQPVTQAEFIQQLHDLGFIMTLPFDGQLGQVDAPPHDVVTNLFMLPTTGKFAVTVEESNRRMK